MFEVTETALEKIKVYLQQQEETSPIRVVLSQGGWSGPSLGMALDELKDDDETFDNDGVTFLVNKDLYEQVKPIKVDFIESPLGARFHVISKLSMQKSEGGSCGSCSC